MLLDIDDRTRQLAALAHVRAANDDPSHDWAHVMRVVSNALALARESGANVAVVLAAALLHDLVNVPKNHPDRVRASRASALAAEELLARCGYSEGEIASIQIAIEEHSYSLGRSPSTLESAVLQDADRLDALGAVGVLRTASCGARFGARYYDAADPFARQRALDDNRYTLDHFYVKLFKLADGFHTERGRQLARQRTAFMETFIAQLGGEMHDAALARTLLTEVDSPLPAEVTSSRAQ